MVPSCYAFIICRTLLLCTVNMYLLVLFDGSFWAPQKAKDVYFLSHLHHGTRSTRHVQMFSIEFIEGAFRATQMPLEMYRVEDWAKGTSIYTPPYFRSLSCTCPVSHRCFSCTYPVLILNSFGIHQVLTVCPLANPLSILYIRSLSCISPFNILLMSA